MNVFTVYTLAVVFFVLQVQAKWRTDCDTQHFRVIDDTVRGEYDWLPLGEFLHKYLREDSPYAHHPVIQAEVSEVPCASKGCCNVLLAFRPKTSDYFAFHQVFVDHKYQQELMRFADLKPKYFLDGGANVGFASKLIKLLYPDAQVIALEPMHGNYMIARINTAHLQDVHMLPLGLWDKQTHVQLVPGAGDEWGSVFLEVPAGTKDSIATTAITNLMSHFNIPHWDVAKIDVEGAEAKVFGADADLSWMTKTKALIAELHHNYANDYFGEGNVHGLVRNAAKGQGMREIDSDHEHVVFEQAS